ncbi:TonB-dependent receptor [Pseudomonas sp.]|uniref:TonB-dependent receptor domain-containing protein n=1 Tax=Pseudomonas sp. TaxID=306 RepID=UPI002583D8EF|nr:TonB-dependent receptor [Pseudomonas sp.]
MGAKDLEPEKSTNISLGVSWEPTRDARITLDAYRIEIKDRIVKSEIIRDTGSSTAVRDTLQSLGINDLYSAQYNMNGVDTRTEGVDLVSELHKDYGRFGKVRWSALYSYNHTTLRDIKQNGTVNGLLGSDYVIFGHQAQTDLTEGSPRDKLILGSNWRLGDFITDLQLTRYGKYTYAIGGNMQAARTSGINVKRHLVIVYSIAGLLAGLAGVVASARAATGQAGMGMSYELDAIAAAVIGGTSLVGGVGRISGTVIGALILGVMASGFTFVGVDAYVQDIIKGVIIVVAVVIDQYRSKRLLKR